MFVWRIKHKPTGLFYCSRKGWFDREKTNLSEKGNFYIKEKDVQKVFEEDLERTNINKAQTERFGLPIKKDTFAHNLARVEDFEIIKYELREIKR